MPNWASNKLTVYSPTQAQVDAFVNQARGFPQRYPKEEEKEKKWGMPRSTPKEIPLCFHALVPIPDEILAGEFDPAGYNKEVELWGVKWGAEESALIAHGEFAHGFAATYSFKTPWGPPEVLLHRLSLNWPNTIFYLSWVLESEARGRIIASNGEIFLSEEDCEIEQGDKDADEWSEMCYAWCAELVGSHHVWLRSMIL